MQEFDVLKDFYNPIREQEKLYSSKDHNNPKRRQNYFNRFSGTKYKAQAIKIERAKGKYTPKLLSHMFLWIVAMASLISLSLNTTASSIV